MHIFLFGNLKSYALRIKKPVEETKGIFGAELPKGPIWVEEEGAEALPAEKPEEKIVEPDKLSTILDALSRWDRPAKELDLEMTGGRPDERGVELPMHSLLQIDGYKSITIQYNKTHYFGESDINRYKSDY